MHRFIPPHNPINLVENVIVRRVSSSPSALLQDRSLCSRSQLWGAGTTADPNGGDDQRESSFEIRDTRSERVIFFGRFGRELKLVWKIAILHVLSGITFNCLPSDPKHLTFDRGCPRDLLVRLLDVLEEGLPSCSRKEPPPGCPLPRTGCPQQAPRRCRSRAQEGQLSASPLPRHRRLGRVAGPASLLGLQLSPSAPR